MNPDFDTEEKDFLRQIDSSLANARATTGPCPLPDLVMAVAAGVEIENGGRILQHVNACPLCQQLTRDLSEHEYPGATEEEDRRIRARWKDEALGSSRRQPRRAWVWQPFVIGTAAAAILLAIAVMLMMREPVPSGPAGGIAGNQAEPAGQPRLPAAKTRTAFVLVKAAIKVPAGAALTVRSGAADGRDFLNDLASALEPYRSDNFAEAARRLEPLTQKYRESAEPHYYLGVSRLFLEQNSALESLEAARRLADETLRDDVSWYLALALDRAGRLEEARREIEALCSRSGDYQKQACAAQEELR
jgi:hypothetical protein